MTIPCRRGQRLTFIEQRFFSVQKRVRSGHSIYKSINLFRSIEKNGQKRHNKLILHKHIEFPREVALFFATHTTFSSNSLSHALPPTSFQLPTLTPFIPTCEHRAQFRKALRVPCIITCRCRQIL